MLSLVMAGITVPARRIFEGNRIGGRISIFQKGYPGNRQWLHRDATYESFASANRDLPAAIAAKVFRNEWDEPEAFYGYSSIVLNKPRGQPTSLSIAVLSASKLGARVANSANLQTADKVPPDPTLVAYEVFKPALLTIAETHDANSCSAYPDDLTDLWEPHQNYNLAWMWYIKPDWAPLITPPSTAIVEHRPNGGLFMAATKETFRTAKPGSSGRGPRYRRSAGTAGGHATRVAACAWRRLKPRSTLNKEVAQEIVRSAVALDKGLGDLFSSLRRAAETKAGESHG